MKRIAILGSTGSIGTQTLDLVEQFPGRLRVTGLAAGRNTELLIQQIKQFHPRIVAIARNQDVRGIREAIGDPRVRIVAGPEGLCEVAREPADLMIGALVGRIGLEPTLEALQCGTDVALANKEVLVIAGQMVVDTARHHGAKIVPIDSEHAAIHQCLAGQSRAGLRRVLLTASGGPFRRATLQEMEAATPEQALAHPNWEMGRKISIDSATLMNKGFEIIEARWLFDLELDQVGAVIHPESIVHSLVEFIDGSWLAQLGIPDMHSPIAYTLAMPERLALPQLAPLDLVEIGALHFEAPDPVRFPALRLAMQVLAAGGTAPTLLNAANEVAVQAFLDRQISFNAIPAVAEEVLGQEPVGGALELDEIDEADRRARQRARSWIKEHSR